MKIQMALGHNLLNPEIRLKKKDLGLKEITDLNEVWGSHWRRMFSPKPEKSSEKKIRSVFIPSLIECSRGKWESPEAETCLVCPPR